MHRPQFKRRKNLPPSVKPFISDAECANMSAESDIDWSIARGEYITYQCMNSAHCT